MAWRELKVIDERKNFIRAYLEKKHYISELCREFNISRKCAYKWIHRFQHEGIDGLKDKSKARLHQAGATDPQLVEQILQVKYEYSKWGPKKIIGYLKNHEPDQSWPSVTTAGNILEKNGLRVQRKLRKRLAVNTSPLADCNESNSVWCMDFKGWSMTKDHFKCDPFTLTDAFSRYLFCCQKLNVNDHAHVWAVIERLFREYGLPGRIRSDNGPPFANTGPGRLSRLSINLLKAGVMPEWIDPGEPQQNGRHERMHLTLEQEGIFPNESMDIQQRKFEKFIEYFNFIRPHEALDQKTPAQIYKPSERTWNGILREPEYPDEFKVARVQSCGKMHWKGTPIYIGRAFYGEPIGILEEDGYKAYYGMIELGRIEEGKLMFERRKGRERK